MTPKQQLAYQHPIAFYLGPPHRRHRSVAIEGGLLWVSILTVNK